MRVSIFQLIVFFQNKVFVIKLININKNLHQSRAGIGRRLKIQRFIEIIAQIINIKIIHSEIDAVIKLTIHIGQLTWEIASSLCSGLSGINIFQTRSFNHLKVNKDWL